MKHVAVLGDAALFDFNVTSGTNMTISMMDADTGELLASQWAAAPENLTQMSHTFADVKRYTLLFNVSNDVSDANVTLTFDVDVPVTGASAVITAARPHEECLLNVTFVNGTRPQFYVTWDTEFSAALTNKSYFVSRHNYSVIGIHEVNICVQNSVSMSNFTVDAYVSYDVADLTLSQVDYSDEPNFRNVTFLSTISNGTHVTMVTTFGDDFFTVMYYDDPPLEKRFSHEYDAVGDYNVTVESFNHISSMSQTITSTVNVAIVGFSVNLPDKVITGKPFVITFSVAQGNPVTFKILQTTVDKSPPALPVASNETKVPAHNMTFVFNSPGDKTLRATAENTVMGEVKTYTEILKVDVYAVISNFSVAMEEKAVPYAKTGEEIKLIVSMTSGSHVGVTCHFGDGKTPETKFYGTREADGKTLDYTHTYTAAGNYSPVCNASNIYSSDVFDFGTVVIQNEIPGITVQSGAVIVAVPDGADEYTVELTTSKLPTNPFCTWRFADGSRRTVFAAALAEPQDAYRETFTYGDKLIGKRTVHVTCSNLVSSVEATVEVDVQQKLIGPFTYNIAQLAVAVKKTVRIGFAAAKGSHANMAAGFGDGSSPTEKQHPNQLDSTAVVNFTHSYETVGNYTINMTAWNDVSRLDQLTDTPIVVQAPLTGLTLESNSPVNYPENVVFTIKMQSGIAENVFLHWQFGDNASRTTYVDRLSAQKPFSYTYEYSGAPEPFHTKLNCSNLISHLVLETYVVVQMAVSGASITVNATHVVTSSIAWFTANTVHGTDIIYTLLYGDGTKAGVESRLVSGTPVEFTHSYATVGNYSVRLTAVNNVSDESKNLDSLIIVQNPISKADITLSPTHEILSTDDPKVTFTLEVAPGRAKPTDVHVTVTFPGIVIKHFVGTAWPAEIRCNFNDIHAGDVTGDITLTNLVSSETLSASIQLQERISGLVVTGPKVAKVGEKVVITVKLDYGSHMVGSVDPGDGIEEVIPKDSITRLFNLTHTYTVADTYSVSVTLKNSFGPVTKYSDAIKVQTPVEGLTLEGDDTVKIPDGVLKLKIVRTTGEPASTPLTIDATYSPETEDRSRTQSLLDTDIELTHPYELAGDYAVRVNVSNDVGSQILSKNISVYEDITVLTLSATESDDKKPVTTSITHRELTFSVDYRTGTKVLNIFEFGDGDTLETYDKTVTHKYTKPGNYDVKVTAKNPVQDGVTATVQLKMLAPLGLERFTFNDTVTFNTSAPFSIEMNGTRNEICFEFKFTDDADATTTLWRGTSRSVCERATDFKTKTFTEIAVPTVPVDLFYVFPRVSVYDIQLTVLSVTDPDVVFRRTVTTTEKVVQCSNPVITVKKVGDSPSNPIVTRRSAGIVLSAINFDITNVKKDATMVLTWEMFEHDIDTNTDISRTMEEYGVEKGTNTIGISPHTLPYGLYKFTLTVELKEMDICSGSGDVFVSIVGTPLDVNIKYGALRLVGFNKPVEMNAADTSNDPDMKEGGSEGMTFEWYCRKEKENDDRSSVVEMPGTLCDI